nr:hypothetical protein [Burkholderiales bacterium]
MQDASVEQDRPSKNDQRQQVDKRAGTSGPPASWITLVYACLVQWPLALLVADGAISKFDAVAGLLLLLSLVLWIAGQRIGRRLGGPG